jgi:uncharacterized membrane protein
MQNDPLVQPSPASPVVTTKSSTGLDENVASLLAYVFGLVSGLIFFLIEKDSRLVRFHGMQSTLLAGVFWIGEVALWILSTIIVLIISQVSGLLGTLVWAVLMLLSFVLGVAALIGWVMCMIKAYQGQYFKLPVLGNFAEKFSQK